MSTKPGSATAPLWTAHIPAVRSTRGRRSRHGRGRSTPGPPPVHFRREEGYITIFVLVIAAAIFLALGAAMQANSCLRDANRRQAGQVQTRAAEISVRP